MPRTFCLDCGTPCVQTRCDEHTKAKRASVRSRSYAREARYYSTDRWKAFTKRMRARQGFCDWELAPGVVCGDTRDLVCDHATEEAYRRQAAGLAFRVSDFRVLCRTHNGVAGSPGDR